MTKELWENEKRLWLEGVDAYDELLHPECIMTFADPVGIMRGPAIVDSLRRAPRWSGVEMTERASANQDGDTMVIAYRAEGTRNGALPYAAYCSSTYVRRDGDWRMIQHQQTPIK